MIDYDLNGEFGDFIEETHRFFSEFNRCNPVEFEIKNEDQGKMCITFFLSRISDSLMNIENAICKGKDE